MAVPSGGRDDGFFDDRIAENWIEQNQVRTARSFGRTHFQSLDSRRVKSSDVIGMGTFGRGQCEVADLRTTEGNVVIPIIRMKHAPPFDSTESRDKLDLHEKLCKVFNLENPDAEIQGFRTFLIAKLSDENRGIEATASISRFVGHNHGAN